MTPSLSAPLFAFAEIIRTIDPDERLQYFSWWAYVAIGVAYTGLVFKNEFGVGGQSIFAGGRGYSRFKVVGVHACFLAAVMSVIRAASFLVFYLPNWMTNAFDAGRNTRVPTSVADLCLVIAISIFAFYEHRRLYADSE